MLNGFIITNWGFPPFIVTLATGTIWTGVNLFIMDVPGGNVSLTIGSIVTGSLFGIVPVPLLIIIAALLIAGFVLKHTVFGRSIYALGGNKEIAVESGIPIRRIEMMTYGISGIFSALSGMYLSAMMISGDPLVGNPFVMNSIAVAVIGGVALSGGHGGVSGILGAAYIFYLIDNILNLVGVSTFYQYVAKGLVIILALTLTSGNRENGKRIKLFGKTTKKIKIRNN
jgi:ribose transport system permease protein